MSDNSDDSGKSNRSFCGLRVSLQKKLLLIQNVWCYNFGIQIFLI